jgi:hypothetical protein
MITQTLHGMEGIEEGFNLMMDPKPADVVKPIVYIDD